MTSRFERNRMANLDTILRRVDDAEKAALFSLRQAGINVSCLAEAREIQAEMREATRLHAVAVERMSGLAVRRSA